VREDPRVPTPLDIAHRLCGAFLEGAWEPEFMAARAGRALGLHETTWVLAVATTARAAFPEAPRGEPGALVGVVLAALPWGDPVLGTVRAAPVEWRPPPPRPPEAVRGEWEVQAEARRAERAERPRPPARVWPTPRFLDAEALAQRLELDEGQLAWLADRRGWERTHRQERLRNYRYRWLARSGGLPRLIERPKARLMESQRIVLREVLDAIPPHDAAHGFVKGRSVRTHAAAHVGARVIVGFDLEDFFASVGAGRVRRMFATVGYGATADVLTALCTNVVPIGVQAELPVPPAGSARELARHRRFGRRLAAPHLPQGAPTSPALANLAAYRLDLRLTAYAQELGATYTRYADDLAFSGDRRLQRGAPALRRAVAEIARDEGFAVHARKTRLMSAAGRQTLCSVVVNERLNVPREEYDRLKAILHDAARHGLDAANREGRPHFRAHLAGRIAWVESLNPAKGARLRARLEAL
jgi:RNA-directed DNA polymerase